MKVVIFSCDTGAGHKAAARALSQELSARNIENEITNPLDFMSKAEKAVIEQGHSLMYLYMPNLYGVGYKEAEKKRDTSLINIILAIHTPRLIRYVKKYGFDTAICVHEFPGTMLTFARALRRLDIRQYFVATDYTCSPGVEKLDMDAWFIPKGLSGAFSSVGIDRTRLVETGIPVASWCYESMDRKAARRELGLNEDMPMILLGAGSIGCGPLEELARRLRERAEGKCIIAVLCGKNEKLKASLSEYSEEGRFIPIAFTDKMRLLMYASDLILTKAGGLSCTESAAVGLPPVFMNLIPGIEEHNLKFFTENGCGITAEGVDGLCDAVFNLLEDEGLQRSIREKQKAMFSENAAVRLIDYVTGDAKKPEE